MFDAFLAAFHAPDPQNVACVLHSVTRDFQHAILRRMLRRGKYLPQPPLIEGDTLELVFDFYAPAQMATPQSRWQLACVGVQYHWFWRHAGEPITDLTITHDHVLLWRHHYPTKDLWVQDTSQLSFAVLAALEQEHHRLVEEWIPLALSLTAPDIPIQPHAAMARTHHLLASGPTPLIDGYAAILERFGVHFTIQNSPLPFMIENTTIYQTDPSNPLALVFGRSYLIADVIEAHLVETPRRRVSRARRQR
jgi:hypothetical protein